METFTFTFKPDRTSTEIKRVVFKSNCFFGATSKFLKHVTAHYPDFLLVQIRDQYGQRFYDDIVKRVLA